MSEWLRGAWLLTGAEPRQSIFGSQRGARPARDNDRFDWNVQNGIYSGYCCLAINWQASVLAMGLA